MSASLCLSMRAAVSDAAHGVNEDAWGHHGRWLWVLDGATGVAQRSCTPGPTDAAWFAQRASERLGALVRRADSDPIPDAASVLAKLQHLLGADFEAACSNADVHDRELPSSCLALVQFDVVATRLQVACIGDITVLLTEADGSVRHLSDDAVARFSASTLAAWRQARGGSSDPAQWWLAARRTILANREMANRPGGYWVLHPRRQWLEGVRWFSVPARAGLRVLVASDGLYRLVDQYAELSDAQLVQQAFEHGLPSLIERLRLIERDDAACERFARVKAADDATAVLAEITASGEGRASRRAAPKAKTTMPRRVTAAPQAADQ